MPKQPTKSYQFPMICQSPKHVFFNPSQLLTQLPEYTEFDFEFEKLIDNRIDTKSPYQGEKMKQEYNRPGKKYYSYKVELRQHINTSEIIHKVFA